MRTVAIIQARMSSRRLPGKSLKMLGNKTVLANIITRIQRCQNIDAVLVATSIEDEDVHIVAEAVKYGALYYRGSLEDVLTRYYKAVKFYPADRIVRITADCPFIMPDLIDEVVEKSRTKDYGSNVIERTYPKGLDCEVFSFDELERAYECATGDEREHVTPYMVAHAMTKFSLMDEDNFSNKRLTLDYDFDYEDLKKYYPIIGEIYDYPTLKTKLNELESTEEWSNKHDLGRV